MLGRLRRAAHHALAPDAKRELVRLKPTKRSRPAHPDDEIFEKLTAPDVSPLVRLVDARSVLTIEIEHSQRPYSSILLEVSIKKGYAVLDDLSNGGLPLALIDTRPRFTARGTLERDPIAFQSTILQTAIASGARYHQIALPAKLEYRKTRAFRRIPLLDIALPIKLHTEDGMTWTGRLRDLSAAGLGALVGAPPLARAPEVGEPLSTSILTVGDARYPLPPLTVTNVSRTGSGATHRFGMQFTDGPRPDWVAGLLRSLIT